MLNFSIYIIPPLLYIENFPIYKKNPPPPLFVCRKFPYMQGRIINHIIIYFF